MRKKFNGRHSVPLLTLLSCASLPLFAQTSDPIGTVLVTRGRVEARDAAGVTRALSRRASIFVQDTVLVGADGLAQIRMVDDAIISFKPDTEFTFNTYAFDANPATPDDATMSMLRGGFRTISGVIGDGDQDRYLIDTPLAGIGIRGTTHEAVIENEVLYTGVYDGGTVISNDQGSLDTGIGADFDFSETREGLAPRGLLEQPDVLGSLDLNPGVGDEEEDDEGDAGADGGDDDGGDDSGDDGGDAAAADDGGGGAGEAVAEGDADAGAGGGGEAEAPAFETLGNTAGAGQTAAAVETVAAPAPAPVAVTALAASTTTTTTTGAPVPGTSPESNINPVLNSRAPRELVVAGTDTPPPPAVNVLDQLQAEDLASLQQGRLGFLIPQGRATSADIIAANASALVNGNLFFAQSSSSVPRTLAASPDFLYKFSKSGSTSATASFDKEIVGDGSVVVPDSRMGTLTASTASGSLFEKHEDTLVTTSLGGKSYFYTTVTPAPLTALNAGQPKLYTFSGLSLGNVNPGLAFASSFLPLKNAMTVSFQNGDATVSDGQASVYALQCHSAGLCTPQLADVAYTGNVADGYLTASVTTQTSKVNGRSLAIQGKTNGVFAGSTGAVFVGGLNLQLDSPSMFAQLVYTMEREERLTREQYFSLDRPALLADASGSYFGLSADLALPASKRLLMGNSTAPGFSAIDEFVFAPGATTQFQSLNSALVGEFDNLAQKFSIGWEKWSGNIVSKYNDRLDKSKVTTSSQPLFMTTFAPGILFKKTGRVTEASAYAGQDTLGNALTALDISFDVDFATGSITDGLLLVATIDQASSTVYEWTVFFDGASGFDEVTLQPKASDRAGRGDSSLRIDSGTSTRVGFANIKADIKGVFVDDGDDEAAFLASFNLSESQTAAKHGVTGLLLGQTIIDNRLTLAQMKEMDTHVGLLVEGRSAKVTLGGSTVAGTGGPHLGINALSGSAVDPGQLEAPFLFIASAPGTAVETPVSRFDVKWGVWDTANLVIMEDHIDPFERGEKDGPSKETLLWATVVPAQLADLSGRVSYGNVAAFNGFDSAGNRISSLAMGFDVDFGSSAITNGTLNAVAGGNTWAVKFDGTVNRAFAEMQNISGSLNNSTIRGEISGVFTGTGSNKGFVAGFGLETTTQSLQGLGVLPALGGQ